MACNRQCPFIQAQQVIVHLRILSGGEQTVNALAALVEQSYITLPVSMCH